DRDGAPGAARAARAVLRRAGPAVRGDHGPFDVHDLLRRPHARPVPGDQRAVAAVQRRPCRRQRRLLPGVRPGPRPRAGALPRAPEHHLDPAGGLETVNRVVPLLLAVLALGARPACASNRSSSKAGARWLAAHVHPGGGGSAADTLVAMRAAGIVTAAGA